MNQSKHENVLKAALSDNNRVKHGLAVVFVTKDKYPSFKSWQSYAKENQSDEEIKKLYRKRRDFTGYSYYTGIGGLIDIDFDWPWLYIEAEKRFGDRFKTLTIQTPNGGYRVLFITNKHDDFLEYKDKPPHIEIHGKKSHHVIVHGQALTEEGTLGHYQVLKDLPIREDPEIIPDFKKFLEEVMNQCYFLEYPCIKSKLRGKKNKLTHEQRTSIGAFMIAENVELELAIHFFTCTDDFDYHKTRDHLLHLKEKNFKHPRCETLRKNFNWDEKDCSMCPRRKQDTTKKLDTEDRGQAVELPSVEEYLRHSREKTPKLRHGQGYDPEIGLTYIGLSFQKGVTVYYGISLEKPISAIDESCKINKKFAENIRVIGGYTDPLNSKTSRQIEYLLQEQHENGCIKNRRLSELFQQVLQRSCDYLDLNEGDRLILILWILGTYLRALFTWYPYLCFEGLRDVGKSTALEFLSQTCYNGGGDVSGGYTEADLHKSASSSMGFFAIDHLEERLKSDDKRQVLNEFLENAWKLNSYVSKRDQNTGEHLKLHLACSVAMGTRRTTETIAEKGIIIRMEETTNTEIRKRSITMHKDPFFQDLERELIAAALQYQDKVKEAYEGIPVQPGLGREYNKFAPLLAMAKVIDDETDNKNHYYKTVLDYAMSYRKNRKSEHEDSEEILLRLILREEVKETTYQDVAKLMEKEGYTKYSWQRARSDVNKLGVVKHYNKKNSPIVLTIDPERAYQRALQRGIPLQDFKADSDPILHLEKEVEIDEEDLNPIQREIILELTNYGEHTRSSLIEELSSKGRKKSDLERELTDLIEKGKITLNKAVGVHAKSREKVLAD